MVQLSITHLMLQPCVAILILGRVTSVKRLGRDIISLCCMNWRICGTPSETFPITGKNKFYITHTWEKSISPTLKPSILHCLLWCKSSSMCESSGRWKVFLLLRLNFLLYKRHYTVFTTVKNCSGCIHFCTELLPLLHSILSSLVTLHSCYVQNFLQNVLHDTECYTLLHLLLQRTSYTVCMHVQNSLHYTHFCKRITWLYSFTCRTFYNAITLV
jgi:hypothetical protein